MNIEQELFVYITSQLFKKLPSIVMCLFLFMTCYLFEINYIVI